MGGSKSVWGSAGGYGWSSLRPCPPLFIMFIIGPDADGNCCDPPCAKGREDPCKCECCPDLPAEICVWDWVENSATNASGCCTQSYKRAENTRKGYLDGGCQYTSSPDGAGNVVAWYDEEVKFWKIGCGISATPECEGLEGYYYTEGGELCGGVGSPKPSMWMQDCGCSEGDPPCDCSDQDPAYTGEQHPYSPYSEPEDKPCTETSDDPCCDDANRKCPSDEGEPPASEACP